MKFTGTFVVVVALFIAVLITSNIIAVKPIQLLTLPFEFLGSASVILPASIIIFPISYIVGDVLTEVYGFRIARGVIWLGFGANLLVFIALLVTGTLPGAPFWTPEEQGAYVRILGEIPPIPLLTDGIMGPLPFVLLGSFVAYLFGEFSNSTVLALLKYKMQSRYLWIRTIGSTVVGQGLDSLIFIFIAFGIGSRLDGIPGNEWGVNLILSTVIFQWIVKILYEAAATPLTYAVVGYMKRKEEMDVTDVPSSLNPLGIFA